MGIADSIPGVSGGTMALILGIYPKLIDAIGSLGFGTVKRLGRGDFWRSAAAAVLNPGSLTEGEDGRDAGRLLFLAFLGVGMVGAIVTGSRVIPSLLDRYPAEMRGFFFGLVLCSVSVPLRMMGNRTVGDYLTLVVAGLLTWLLLSGATRTDLNATGAVEVILREPSAEELTLDPTRFYVTVPGADGVPDVVFAPPAPVRVAAGQVRVAVPILARMAGEWGNVPAGSIVEAHGGPEGARVVQGEATSGGQEPSRVSLFVAGFVAISAMVLPGISGSFILLLFGLYHYVTHSLRLAVFQRDPAALMTVVTVVVAIGVGLLTVTRVIKVLLDRFRRPTLAALSGLMLGSLRVLWPFTEARPDGTVANVWPSAVGGPAWGVVATFLFGSALILVLEAVGRGRAADPAVRRPGDPRP